MERALDVVCRGLEAVIAACLVGMVVLVFGNVVLRYGFNTGITVSEELSRWLFVWMIFLGSIVALREHRHLGTEMLVGRLGPRGRTACLVVGYLLMLMLMVCWLLFSGALEQTRINWDVAAPSSGFSMAWFYAAGAVFAVGAGGILLIELVRLLTGRTSADGLSIVRESEEGP